MIIAIPMIVVLVIEKTIKTINGLHSVHRYKKWMYKQDKEIWKDIVKDTSKKGKNKWKKI